MKFSMMSYTMARQIKQEKIDIRAMCALTKELGMDGIDFVTTYGADPKDISKIVRDYGLKVVCHTFFSNLATSDKQQLSGAIDAVKQGIETAFILGTDIIMIPVVNREKLPRDESKRYAIQGLNEASVFARESGITLTIENFPGQLSPFVTSDDFLEAARQVEGLKLTFDNGNVLTGGEDPACSFERTSEYIVHAHFKDWICVDESQGEEIKGLDGRTYKAALIGEGIVDHLACLRAMRSSGYSGYINIEYEGNDYPPDVSVRKALAYLRGLALKLESENKREK